MTDDAIAPQPDARLDPVPGEWKRVSPKYIVVDVLGYVITAVIILIVALVLHFALDQLWVWWVAGPLLAIDLISAMLDLMRS